MTRLSFDLALAEAHDGTRVAFVVPSIPEDAPPAVREGLARRRITAIEGECPCGATMTLPNRAMRRLAKRTGGTLHATVLHEADCPAGDQVLEASFERWGAS